MRKGLLIGIVVVLVIVGGTLFFGRDTWATAKIGTVYVAKQTCSCLFVAGRPMDSCRTDYDPAAIEPLTVEKLEHGAVVPNDVLKEQLRFAAHGKPERIVELGEAIDVRPYDIDILELQPLSGEVFHQRRRLRIAHHALDLGCEHGGPPQRSAPMGCRHRLLSRSDAP